VKRSAGALFGTTLRGGIYDAGTVVQLNEDGTGYSVLHHFGTGGYAPYGALIEGADLALYGIASAGGSNSLGTIFKLNKDGGGYSVLYNFGGPDGRSPRGGLLHGTDG